MTVDVQIEYREGVLPEPAVVAALYRVAGLVRPVDDLGRIGRMYASANLVLTAWVGERLVGALRAWNDGGFLAYIADLAVDPDYQRLGIGRELLRRAVTSDPEVTFLLHAAPAATEYYPRIGWQPVPSSWRWPRER